MGCLRNVVVTGIALGACVTALAQAPTYNRGKALSEEEIRAWDIAVGPEGKELPSGNGTARDGAKLFAQKCAACHGPAGEGGLAPRLVGNPGTGEGLRRWPFAPLIWGYINASMPLDYLREGSLSANEVYSLTAFLLFKNAVIQEDEVIDATRLRNMEMPNLKGYVPPPEWRPGMRRPFALNP